MADTSKFPQRTPDRRLCVAPMMDWTDRHCRYFHRMLAPSALLFTEMVTTGAVLHGDRNRLLAYNPEEHPLALQLGRSIRWPCSSAAATPPSWPAAPESPRTLGMTRSTSTWAARPIASSAGASGPA
jgi:tRNA-dihydrouridine synthase A